jgi:hypothetical protein
MTDVIDQTSIRSLDEEDHVPNTKTETKLDDRESVECPERFSQIYYRPICLISSDNVRFWTSRDFLASKCEMWEAAFSEEPKKDEVENITFNLKVHSADLIHVLKVMNGYALSHQFVTNMRNLVKIFDVFQIWGFSPGVKICIKTIRKKLNVTIDDLVCISPLLERTFPNEVTKLYAKFKKSHTHMDYTDAPKHVLVRLLNLYLAAEGKINLKMLDVDDKVVAKDEPGFWYNAIILKTTPEKVYVSYDGWSNKYDTWLLRKKTWLKQWKEGGIPCKKCGDYDCKKEEHIEDGTCASCGTIH